MEQLEIITRAFNMRKKNFSILFIYLPACLLSMTAFLKGEFVMSFQVMLFSFIHRCSFYLNNRSNIFVTIITMISFFLLSKTTRKWQQMIMPTSKDLFHQCQVFPSAIGSMSTFWTWSNTIAWLTVTETRSQGCFASNCTHGWHSNLWAQR